jgi:hypothetical protein
MRQGEALKAGFILGEMISLRTVFIIAISGRETFRILIQLRTVFGVLLQWILSLQMVLGYTA